MIMSMILQFPFLALVNLGKAWKSLKNRITHQGEGSWVWISLTLRWWWGLWIGSIIEAYQEQQEELKPLTSSPFSTNASLPLHLISRRSLKTMLPHSTKLGMLLQQPQTMERIPADHIANQRFVEFATLKETQSGHHPHKIDTIFVLSKQPILVLVSPFPSSVHNDSSTIAKWTPFFLDHSSSLSWAHWEQSLSLRYIRERRFRAWRLSLTCLVDVIV